MIKNIVDRIADRTRWGYLVAFIILLVSYIVSFVSTQNVMKQSELVNHSSDVIHSLDNVIGYVTQCESAARGYMLTDDKKLLLKYNASRNITDSTFNNVKTLTADNPHQQKNLDSLKVLINDKLLYLENAIATFDSTHTITNQLLIRRTEGIIKMNRVEDFA